MRHHLEFPFDIILQKVTILYIQLYFLNVNIKAFDVDYHHYDDIIMTMPT